MSKKRQLAAIVFTDISNFTSLMDKDESNALNIRHAQRDNIQNALKEFDGEYIKEIGDGDLIIFNSATDAVNFTLKLHSDIQPNNSYTIRAAIHLGDVIREGEDIFGAGVNMASHIHTFASPGCTIISHSVYQEIKNKSKFSINSIGEKNVKGIDEPIHVHQVSLAKDEISKDAQIDNNYVKKSFSDDLLERRVPRFIGVYLAISWGIIQFISWSVDRYLLSPHLVDLSLSIAISMLPSILIVSYFHGMPGKDKWQKIEKIVIPANVLIAIVVLFVSFYPKNLGAVTENVMLTDEEGNQFTKMVVKSEFRKKIAIFYFENETGDSTLDWLKYGLPWLCNSDLKQDFYISHITQEYFDFKIENAGYSREDKLPLSLKKKISRTLNKNYFIEGSFNVIDKIYTINARLYETENGSIIAESRLADEDLFSLIDKLVRQLKIDLQIPLQYLDTTTDLPVQSITTDNMNALKSLIQGDKELDENETEAAAAHYKNSIAFDKYFLQAHRNLSYIKMMYLQDSTWKEHWDIILKSIDKLTDRTKFNYKISYYNVTGDEELYKKLALRQVKLYPLDIQAHDNLADVYFSENNPERFNNVIREYKIILDLDPERYEYYKSIGRVYSKMAQHDSSLYYFTKYTETVPDDPLGYYYLAESYHAVGEISDAISALQNGIIVGNQEQYLRISLLWKKHNLNKDTSYTKIINELNNMLAVSEDVWDSVGVYKQLSYVYENSGELKNAVHYMNITNNLIEVEEGLFHAIGRLVSHKLELFIEAGLDETYKKHLKYIENNAVSPHDKMIPYYYANYYLHTEDFDMLAAIIDEAESGYGDY